MREFGSEHPALSFPDGYFDSLKKFGREVTYLRSGREALMYASYNCKLRKNATILLPAYCCWSMFAPFEKTGWNINFYRLDEDLTVDEDYLSNLLKICKPDAILTMNFYGSAFTDPVIDIIKQYNEKITIIEDFTHCTFSLKKIYNSYVDYYVSSIRKSIGVCDGSVIICKNTPNKDYIQSEEKEFADKRFIAQTKKVQYSFSKDQNAKDVFLAELRECEGLINEFNAVRPISARAAQMLNLVDGKGIAYARRENMKHIFRILNGKVRMLPKIERCFDGAPFSLPILLEKRDEVQYKMAQKGVYAPILWPICEKASKVCSNSTYVAEHLLSIPIDQRYDWDDMEEMGRIIIETVQ
ncbi:MAG: hypothetical protein PHS38_10025 [Bacteroidales bacterium]|nr:hypothetical protein [Bacteroidales bacterium]